MNDEKIISPAGLAAGQQVAPGYGVGLPEVHVGDIKHRMTPIDQLQAEGRTTTAGNIPLRQIMQDIVAKDKMSRRQEAPVVEEVVAEDPKPALAVNPHKKQSLQRAVQRQTEADLREPEAMFDDTQKAMREAPDKIQARSMRDKSAASEQMSVSDMMARDEISRSKRTKKSSAVRNAPELSESASVSEEVSKGKSLEAKVNPNVVTGPLKKSTGKAKAKVEEAAPTVAVWQSSVSDLNKKFEVPIKAKEGSQGLKRVEHHNMSRSDRLAALEAKLGGTVAKVRQNEAEQQLDE